MGGLSWWHWLVILAVFILLFGAKKLPDAARGVGRSLRILKSEVSAMSDDEKEQTVAPAPPVTPVAPAVALTVPVTPAPATPATVAQPAPVASVNGR
ncbi:Sec-independent protein translocase subunit TatA [Nakamurella flava]|uniref:Sec-independent protein translocase protein TatA n=1 Tax=Nakamurella flava TaxID=2576308 RepID=A0A4U6QJX5_9ACTN|nr:Sec-independent protein translocase subunit TatA [Nakamurella flava]TKV60402.1 Sec-independent protein translocase subunit TatA [Nakamurella flava]